MGKGELVRNSGAACPAESTEPAGPSTRQRSLSVGAERMASTLQPSWVSPPPCRRCRVAACRLQPRRRGASSSRLLTLPARRVLASRQRRRAVAQRRREPRREDRRRCQGSVCRAAAALVSAQPLGPRRCRGRLRRSAAAMNTSRRPPQFWGSREEILASAMPSLWPRHLRPARSTPCPASGLMVRRPRLQAPSARCSPRSGL